MKNAYKWIIVILSTLLIAGLSTLFTRMGMDYFNGLNQPSFTPPEIVFPIVWSAVYILFAISAGLCYTKGYADRYITALYITNAVLNVLWSLVVFSLGQLALGVAVILAYITVTVLLIFKAYKANKTAGLLLIPQLIWLCVALALNYSLVMLN